LIWQDKQHQVLFEMIDDLSENRADFSIFTRLTEYAENHFNVEEEYMRRLDYPGAEEHIRAHDKFREELCSMVDHRYEYDEVVKQSLSLFLSEWLKRHVYGIDKKLEQFVMESEHK
jgi:hemerythrin